MMKAVYISLKCILPLSSSKKPRVKEMRIGPKRSGEAISY